MQKKTDASRTTSIMEPIAKLRVSRVGSAGAAGGAATLRRHAGGILSGLLLIINVLMLSTVSGSNPGMPWVAVHDFSVPDAWREKGRTGWQIASGVENELVQSGRFNVVTRAKIAQVLKERNITSSSSMKPADFGQIVGADYIVTGQIDDVGGRVTMIGKLIKVKGENSGKIEKSFDVSGLIPNDKIFSERFPLMLGEIAAMLTKTPGELLDDGLVAMKRGDFVSAVRFIREMTRQIPERGKIRQLTAAAAGRYGRTPPSSILSREEQQMSPGRLLDHALKLMSEGAGEDAGKLFYVLEHSRLERGIEALLQAVSEQAAQKQAHIEKIVAAARLKYRNGNSGSNFSFGVFAQHLIDCITCYRDSLYRPVFPCVRWTGFVNPLS